MKNILIILAVFFIQHTVFTQALSSQEGHIIRGELIIELEDAVTAEIFLNNLSSSRQGYLEHIRRIAPTSNIHLFSFEETEQNGEEWLTLLKHHPDVKTLQRNYVVAYRETTPDDPEFDLQWGLRTTGITEVWDETTGGVTAVGDTIVVAILDSGFDVEHEDYQGNLWKNRGEIPNDAIDNDNNGYIDDYHGYDFQEDTASLKLDTHGHSVAGIIGAKGNNDKGVSGINWDVKMMLLRTRTVDRIIEAYEYIIAMRQLYNETNGEEGAFIVATNASFGVGRKFCDTQETWGSMYDRLGEVGILTGAGTDNQSYDVDELGDIPATCPTDYMITVLNTTIQDEKYQGSAYGKTYIDMGAPGENSYTTKLNNAYGPFSGNSAAAPHITGAIALLYSLPCEDLGIAARDNPAETALQIKDALMNGVDTLEDLTDLTVTGGRMNVFNSMVLLQEFCDGTTGDLAFLKVSPNPTSSILTVDYETPDFESYALRIFNAIGQLMYHENLQPYRFGIKSFRINVEAWAAGVYFVTLERDGEMITEKFVKY